MVFRRARGGKAGGAPVYVIIPSVRPAVVNCLSKWFVHAIEAAAGSKANGLFKSAAKAASPSERVFLGSVGRRIMRVPRMSGGFGHEIHFVVVDNSAQYHEVPSESLHAGRAVSAARALNRVGNKAGVFVHYITPADLDAFVPGDLRDGNEFFHKALAAPGAREIVKLGPGGASNVGMAYARSVHGDGKPAFFLRMDDDAFPPMFRRQEGSRVPLNFFRDLGGVISGKRKFGRGYRGYYDFWGARMTGKYSSLRSNFKLREVADFSKVPYYPTEGNEDQVYSARFKGRAFEIPDYLVNAGGKSTWSESSGGRLPGAIFGRYHATGATVGRLPKKLVESVLDASGVDRKSCKALKRG
ncbi:MAG: hypothetical protein WC792_06125 [Candidatus Micrarchaeia archaeon]|jgi:hypothetical protein